MTEAQRIQLREIIDLNWDLSQEKDMLKKISIANDLSQKKQALREDMGHAEYDHFMEMGRQMFQPKK